jgi:hypothetical protein
MLVIMLLLILLAVMPAVDYVGDNARLITLVIMCLLVMLVLPTVVLVIQYKSAGDD